MSNTPTYKITVLQDVRLSSPVITDDKLKTSASNNVLLPSSAGTLALVADVNAQKGRIDRLLDYLEAWISCGNLSMADIKASVDPAQSGDP